MLHRDSFGSTALRDRAANFFHHGSFIHPFFHRSIIPRNSTEHEYEYRSLRSLRTRGRGTTDSAEEHGGMGSGAEPQRFLEFPFHGLLLNSSSAPRRLCARFLYDPAHGCRCFMFNVQRSTKGCPPRSNQGEASPGRAGNLFGAFSRAWKDRPKSPVSVRSFSARTLRRAGEDCDEDWGKEEFGIVIRTRTVDDGESLSHRCPSRQRSRNRVDENAIK